MPPKKHLWIFSLLVLLACGRSTDEPQMTGGSGGLKPVPRNRALILGIPQMRDYASFNPFIPGESSATGRDFLFEPLYFYNAYREEENLIPWVAESHSYNDDYTEVRVKIRPGVQWSDGTPWTAHDLAFTIDMLKAHAPELLFSTDMETWVDEVRVEDELTAHIVLKEPNPRFVFSYFTFNFGNGIHIVPKHIWQDKDPTTFTNLDAAKGWPVVSGPYTLALSVAEQRVWDLRPDWWAAKTGFRPLPKVERIIYIPLGDENKWVQMILADQMDSCIDLRPSNIKSLLDQNPNVTTWSGHELPYGYRDWWPPSLGFNNLEPPFDDADIRWAINHAINREQLVEIGWQGAGEYTLLPFPAFPPLKQFTDKVSDLLEKYPVGEYNPDKTAAIMKRKGWSKDEGGFWSKDGERFRFTIVVFPSLFQDFTPVMVEQLRRAGFDASFREFADAYTDMTQGTARAFVMGNGGSVRDPYFTLRLYHSRYVQPTGTATTYFWRWRNSDFDELVDRMGQTAPDDPEMVPLFRQAMEVWLKELPSVPLLQWFHRIPHNQTYWKNWPSAENPYMNSAYWVRSWLVVLLGLEPAQG